MGQRRLTIIDFAKSLPYLWLRPRGDTIPEHCSQAPSPLGQLWQAKMMVHLAQGQWLTQPGFMFTQGIDATADRRHMLAQV